MASAVFATQYSLLSVLIGVLAALGILSFLALFLGKALATKIDGKKIHLLSGFLFIGLGSIYLLFSLLPYLK